MECPSEKQLAELADGALPATGAARLQAHVDGCDLCQKTMRSLVTSEATLLETSIEGKVQLSSSWDDSLTLKSLVGQKVGEYRVEEMIGSGGMGVVYRGVHPIIGRPVAIKVLRPELAADAANVEAMLSEARAVASIGHRGIVDVFAYGELPDGRHYMVMELLNGEALNRLIRREAPLPPRKTVELLDAILDSLEAAHEAGVVHRDLKPSNLFVVKAKQKDRVLVKLLDFGLAKRGPATGKTNASVLMGTPGYMAPEQIRLAKTDVRTDLYSLGVVAFELATGRRPFKADDMAALLLAHTDQTPPAPSSIAKVPRQLEQWILALLAKNPDERPATAEVVRERLNALDLDDDADRTEAAGKPLIETPQEAPTGSNEVPSEPLVLPKRNWVPIIGASAAGLLLLVAAIVFATSGESNAQKTVIELPSPYKKPVPVAVVEPPPPVKPPVVEPETKTADTTAAEAKRPKEKVVTPTKTTPAPPKQEATPQAKLLARVRAVRAHIERGGDADSLALVMVQDAENNVKSATTDEALRKADKLVRELEHRYGH
jgi:serine/threonine-protein kinase